MQKKMTFRVIFFNSFVLDAGVEPAIFRMKT